MSTVQPFPFQTFQLKHLPFLTPLALSHDFFFSSSFKRAYYPLFSSCQTSLLSVEEGLTIITATVHRGFLCSILQFPSHEIDPIATSTFENRKRLKND